MGSETENIIDTIFNTILSLIQQWKHQMKEGGVYP